MLSNPCARPSQAKPFTSSCRRRSLVIAVALALSASAIAPAFSQEADATPDSKKPEDKAQTLDTVSVTGSHIRRVDGETSSPVITIDRQQIEDSGKSTIGDLLQHMPAMAGFMPNTSMNSGFSHGRALVSLRDLGPQRTLVLVDGHRMASPASSVAAAPGVDVNSIPAAMVERIDVLTDGASSVYGSDAIAGVVNIILKDRYDGAAVSVDYGESGHGDGNRRNVSAEWGKSWDRGSIIVGASTNSMNALYDSDRSFAQRAEQYTNGTVSEIRGSGTVATLTDGTRLAPNANLPSGVLGAGDYHQFVSGVDGYNSYFGQYLVTPVQRENVSARATFDFTPNVQGYLDFFWTHSKTTSQLTSYTMGLPSGVVDNYYNPFGADLSRFSMRSIGGQTRVYKSAMFQTNLVGGLRGAFADTSWQWDVSAGTARYKDTLTRTGFSITSAFNNAVGASFMDSDGAIKCGTPGNVIAGCTPINVFNPDSPDTVAAIRQTQTPVGLIDRSVMKFAEANVNGTLLTLPAGDLQAAFGLSWRKNDFSQDTTNTVAAADADGNCDYMDGCIMQQGHDENIKEAYAEFLVPLLKQVPFAYALNLNVGTRYSKYNAWGNTTNSKVALEWRPVENLLIRATGSQVFRAPALGDLYGSPYNGVLEAADISDPCAQSTAGNPAACQNVPTDGSFSNTQPMTVLTTGSANAGFQIKPESGHSYSVGFVYDPEWTQGLSFNADWWRVELDDMITGTDYNTVIADCQAGDSNYCGLIHRDAAGQLVSVSVPYAVNLGTVDVRGYDMGMRYQLPETALGKFNLGLDATYMERYRISGLDHNFVGENSANAGDLPHWRATMNVNWDKGPWHANWSARYVGKTAMNSAYEDDFYGYCVYNITGADGSCAHFDVGSVVYHDVSLSRKIEKLHLDLSGGVNNLFDRDPPRFWGYSANAANTDASTYDTMGRFFWVKARLAF
jgi:outer membrane receptor protein involved in Fe transport